MTGTKNWILCDNVAKRKSLGLARLTSLATAKAGMNFKIIFWWDWKGPVHFEFLP